MRGILTAATLLLSVAAVPAAEVYKWKDADGRTHVSDRPPADGRAERLPIRVYAPPANAAETRDTASATNVVMLSASWCGVCKRARAWMKQNGVAFTEYDVERDSVGREKFRRLGGRGVPIILVGDQRMDGFSAARLQAMLRR